MVKRNRGKIYKAARYPGKALMAISHRMPFLFRWMSDESFLKMVYYWVFFERIDLVNPQTYSEKLQWIKLYDRNPRYCDIVDKLSIKDYLIKCVGDSFVIPTLAVYNSASEIDPHVLPESFVIKCTHDSGSTIVCRHKTDFNDRKIRIRLEKKRTKNYYYMGREWPYKQLKGRIIVEPLLGDGITPLWDYKFFCFSGKAKMVCVCTDRGIDTKFNYYDMSFQLMPFTRGHPNAEQEIKKPHNFDEMRRIAEKVAAGFKHLRVDMYCIGDKIYIGELTLFDYIKRQKKWVLTDI